MSTCHHGERRTSKTRNSCFESSSCADKARSICQSWSFYFPNSVLDDLRITVPQYHVLTSCSDVFPANSARVTHHKLLPKCWQDFNLRLGSASPSTGMTLEAPVLEPSSPPSLRTVKPRVG